jgi:hypothetical protein
MMLGLARLQCRRVRHALWDYVAERLSEGPMETVERHLITCAACKREAESMRQAQGLLTACRREPIPAPRSDWNSLRARLQAEGQTMPRAVAEHHPIVHSHLRHVDRLAATRRNRWVHSLSRSGALACVFLLAAFGYRSLHMLNMSNRQLKDTRQQFASTEQKSDGVRTSAETTDATQGYDPSTGGWDASAGNDFAANSPDPVVGRPTVEHSPMLTAAHKERHPRIADALHLPHEKSSIQASSRDKALHFRPYKLRPEDALPQTDAVEDRYAMSNVVPIPNSSNGIYATPSLTPVQYDGEAPY